jgi:hypothetical protein
VVPRAGGEAVERRKIPSPCRELNLGRPARRLITILNEVRLFFSFRGLRPLAYSIESIKCYTQVRVPDLNITSFMTKGDNSLETINPISSN